MLELGPGAAAGAPGLEVAGLLVFFHLDLESLAQSAASLLLGELAAAAAARLQTLAQAQSLARLCALAAIALDLAETPIPMAFPTLLLELAEDSSAPAAHFAGEVVLALGCLAAASDHQADTPALLSRLWPAPELRARLAAGLVGHDIFLPLFELFPHPRDAEACLRAIARQ